MAFDRAIEKALDMVEISETLIIVTADHGHTMSMSGYQSRGADIRGKEVLAVLEAQWVKDWVKDTIY